jgi:hypothetical protein
MRNNLVKHAQLVEESNRQRAKEQKESIAISEAASVHDEAWAQHDAIA